MRMTLPSRAHRWMLRAAAVLALAGAAVGAQAGPSLWRVPGTFVDDNDRRVSLAEVAAWAGPGAVVAMDSSECRFICSTQWRKLMEVQAAADRRGRAVRFVIISIDPVNDTPAMWRQYRREKGLQRDNWRFLVGSRQATDLAAAAIGLRWWMHDTHIIHDFRLVRLDAQGQVGTSMDNFALAADAFLGD